MTSFFHAYDLRGTYPDEIGEEEAERIGKAFGTFTDADEVLVGRDGREHGQEIMSAFVSGVRSTGVDVAVAGQVPTPLVYFGQIENGFEASAVVTASHNPPEYTGFKFAKEEALAMSRKGGMERIEEIYEEKDFSSGEGSVREIEIEEDYIEHVASKVSADIDVFVNYGNGVTAGTGRELLETIGCSVRDMNGDIDGSFPSHLPDPGNSEAQEALISRMEDEELGIIFDGDGDRSGFVLPGYGYVEPDKVIALLAENSLERKNGKVIHDLRASKLVPETVRSHGGEPKETRVGHTFISEEIHSDPEVVFAGELSGHYYFPAYGMPFDDGLFAAALICQLASETDLREKIESYPEYPVSPEFRIDCPETAKEPVMEEIAEIYSEYETSEVDGVKVYFDTGWALFRPSNTEPKMSLRCEAEDQDPLDEIVEETRSNLEDAIESCS